MLPQNLGPVEVRILGSLIEKELATPDHYPLSLNSLTSACNQSSNRDPVMLLEESAVSEAINTLRRQNLVRSFQASGSRVPKFQHLLTEAGELSRPELAVISVLMLRGPQTIAELRTRAARLLPGDDAEGVESAVEGLVARAPSPALTRLSRRPGQKETRFAHLLGGEVVNDVQDTQASVALPSGDRLGALEEATRELRKEVDDLRAQLAAFRKQFE